MRPSLEQIEALFNRALEFRPEQRAAFLAGACGQDSALLARVRTLIEVHQASEGIFTEEPKVEATGDFIAEKIGDRIGPYKLLEQIGEGGCGLVYMAEQERPVRRRVALKVIKLGMQTKQVMARFDAERAALALMDHPNIARVLDAGATPTGRPFFVMDLVRGVKITEYCDANALPAAQRLELFIQVCRAIQHAHQKGIVHRDIKPSNVLVTVHDGAPVPKVIDFGIAKSIEGRLTDQTLFTSFEQFVGTPAYMSPEQAQLKGMDLDTRTDIYSLGVLLYELLTGMTPFDVRDLLCAGLDEMRRTIREKEPMRPSTKLTLELARSELAKQPKATPSLKPPLDGPTGDWLARRKELVRLLRGDLDWIVMKCLEKDRARRYETANGLAMDLQRHLNGEPVVARPPSNLYRFQKLVRRNKLLFTGAAAVALTLVLGSMGSTWEAIRARRAEREQVRLRGETDKARAGETRQRIAAEQHLYEALLGEARAKQLSGLAGQRFESLDAIAKAAAIHSSTALSDAAVSAFALPDLREQTSWRLPSHWMAEDLRFDDAFQLYACRTVSGISVRRLQDHHELFLLPIPDVSDPANGLLLRCFDPTSRYLAAFCITRDGQPHSRVWDLSRAGALALDLPCSGEPDFSPDGQAIAVAAPDATVSIVEINSGKELQRFHADSPLDMLRFSPDGKKLAGLQFGNSALRIWDVASGLVTTTFLSSNGLFCLAWNGDGSRMAAGSEHGRIDIWDVPAGRLSVRMQGPDSRVTILAFSHQGDLLASAGWDRTLRLWDPVSGKQLALYPTQDTDLHFSADDHTLAYAVERETCRLLEVAHSTGYRQFDGGADLSRSWTVDFSPDGRLLVTSHVRGIGIWDVITGKELGLIQTTECRSAHFQTNGGFSIIGSTEAGLLRWPLRSESTAAGAFLRVGPPERLDRNQSFRYSALDRAGRKILASKVDGQGPLLLELSTPPRALTLQGHPGTMLVSLDPTGRWAATGTWKGTGVKVYDASTGQALRELPVKGSAFVAFSPDGQWLATADMTEFRLWRTDTWKALPQSISGDGVTEINPLAFSPDGQLLALLHAGYDVQIVRVPSCAVIATLRPPTPASISSLCFSPDSATLAALEWSGRLDLWDLNALRHELQKWDLDWNLAPTASSSAAPPAGPAVLKLDAAPFSKEELSRAIPTRDAHAAQNLIDLTDFYNAPLTESWSSPGRLRNDLSGLPQGVHTFGGIEFDVRGLIQIGAGAANGLVYPNHVHHIPIGRSCRRLHFLHAAVLASRARPGDELGSYIFHYTDGHEVELPIITGKDMADWWSQPNEQNLSSLIAWTGTNPAASRAGCTIRLFKTTWENPSPDVPISQLDFVSDKPTPGQPFLVAITAEP